MRKPRIYNNKAGKRADLNNQFFRSATEANYARFMNFTGVVWKYEPEILYFEGIKSGCTSIKIDFYLPDMDQWHEVKGELTQRTVTKIKRLKKYYPHIFDKLFLITQGKQSLEFAQQMRIPYIRYEEIEKKVSRMIPGWE